MSSSSVNIEEYITMKMMDTKEYVSVLRELVESGRAANVVVAGSSMTPFLVHGRDTVYFQKPQRALRVGDIVFYQRENGQFILHRICRVVEKEKLFDIIGDAGSVIEPGVRRGQIFAVVTRAKRKGKWIGPGDFWWEFFEHVWVRIIPLRRLAGRVYRKIRKDRNGEKAE